MNDLARRPFAILGATGLQGGFVVDALLAAGAPVRAVVRNIVSARSQGLAARGVEVVRGDQDHAESLEPLLRDVEAVFLMTTFSGADGTAGETRRGIAVAEASARAAVPRVVYSSVGGADRNSGVPHFESKRRIEQRLSALLPTTFLRPTFFMDNFRDQLTRETTGELVIRLPLPPTTPLQMVAAHDVGVAGARLLLDSSAIQGDAIEIAGDELTPEEITARIGHALQRRARFEQLPVESLPDDDLVRMFRWAARTPAFQADFVATRQLVPDVSDLSTWLAGEH